MGDGHYLADDVDEVCEGCGGTGFRAHALPSCLFTNFPQGWQFIERCDLCEVYENDLEAAQALSGHARWIECHNGALHAVAPD
jgi:hypothetical protein